MDEQTKQALCALGWRQEIGRDAEGRPYVAWIRGRECFHVTLDSKTRLDVKRETYNDETMRKAYRVVAVPL